MWTRVLLSTEHSCCVTMKMTMARTSEEQLTLSAPRMLVWPRDSQGPRQPTNWSATSPFPAWMPAEDRVDVLAGNRQTGGPAAPPVETVSPSVRVFDRSTTLPQLHSQRLQWEITFFGEPHLFFKWPYLSLKKMRHFGTMGAGMFFVF